jgi:NAD(P)H dehydrogenase (quinone)
MSGEIKTFFDNRGLPSKFDLFRERKMRNKIGAAFATGGAISNGKEVTMLSILSATTGPDSPGIDVKELAEARELGKRVGEVTVVYKRGAGK